MKRSLLAVPLLAGILIASFAAVVAAYPLLNIEDMTQEEKDLTIQALELKQEMLQDRIAYLKGEITEEQFQQNLEGYHEQMQPLRDQLREQMQLRNPDATGCGGRGGGFKGFGQGMMGMGL